MQFESDDDDDLNEYNGMKIVDVECRGRPTLGLRKKVLGLKHPPPMPPFPYCDIVSARKPLRFSKFFVACFPRVEVKVTLYCIVSSV